MDSAPLPIGHLGIFHHLHLNESNSPSVCFPTSSVQSNGLWIGDSPLNYSFNLLMFQLSVISIVSCTLYIILKPLGHPAIVNQIIAGIILGRSFLCQNKEFRDTVFPERGKAFIETLALFGFMYHMFLIGVRMDIGSALSSEKRVVAIGLIGWFTPLIFGSCAAAFIRKYLHIDGNVPRVLRLIVGTQSASSSAVISCFLIDLKILNSELGRLAAASSVVSDCFSLLITGIFKIPVILQTEKGVGNIVGSIVSVLFLWTIVTALFWAASRWVVKRTPPGKPVQEVYIFCFIAALLAFSFFGQATGQGYILVPFALGLAIPDGPPLGSVLEERLSSFVSLVIMPIFFSLCGVKTNFFTLEGSLWGIHLVIIVCFLAKLAAVMSVNIYCKMPVYNAFILGLIMNSKGIIELAMYNTWLTDKVLSREIFSVLIFAILLITLLVSRLVQTLYNPTRRYVPHRRRTIQHAKRNTELGILTCVHNQDNVPNIIQILDLSNPNKDNPLSICVVHLVELVGRAASLMIQHKRYGEASSTSTQSKHIIKAFRLYEEMREGLVWVEIFTSVSPSATLHDDVCSLALDKRSALIIIPFHKQWVAEGAVESSTAIRNLNFNVLEKAPCSVGILISRTHLSSSQYMHPKKRMFWISVLFFGGADDREALSYGMRMVEHHNVKLTVIRITAKLKAYENEKISILDNELLNEFKRETIQNDRVWHKEEIIEDGAGVMHIIQTIQNGYDLVMVGRRHMESPLTTGLTEWTEHPELGIIGDILATYEPNAVPSILVVQQQPLYGSCKKSE